MKYSVSIEINQPVDKVIALFDNPDNLKKWMRSLESFEHISGTPGQPGARSKLTFKNGNRKVELIETITVRDLPREFSGTYEAPGVREHISNHFTDLGNGRTRYTSEQEFKFSGFMKVIGWLMPGAFKKEGMKHLQDFKAFAEGENSN